MIKSVLKPETSVMTGVAEAALIIAIYTHNMPSAANVRANGQPNDEPIESARKSAAYQSAGMLGLIFLLTRDWNSFLIGGAMLGGIDFWMKHHNATLPATNKATTTNPNDGAVQPVADQVYTQPASMDEADGTEWMG